MRTRCPIVELRQYTLHPGKREVLIDLFDRELVGIAVWLALGAAILLPAAFFPSVLSPEATEPNALIYLVYVGAESLAVGPLILGVGMISSGRTPRHTKGAAKAGRGA